MTNPYYQDEAVTIYHGDCREILPDLPKVDLVLTDPPYGKRLENHARGKERRKSSFRIAGDGSQDVGIGVLSQYAGVPRIAFAAPMSPWPGEWNQWLIWDKGGAVGGGGDVRRYWKMTWELIQVAGLGLLIGQRDNAVLRVNMTPADSILHPAQKPVRLLKQLISKTSLDMGLILDPFLGSGATAVAGKALNRKCIGIEIEERYCEIAANRCRQQVLDMRC